MSVTLLYIETTKSSQLFYWRYDLEILKKIWCYTAMKIALLKPILMANTIESNNKKTVFLITKYSCYHRIQKMVYCQL